MRICAALIERVRYAQQIAHPIHIAFDEWNVWYRTRSHEDRVGGVEERYNLSDALAVATYLNGFIRHCRHGADGQLRPARERHRADLHESATGCSCRRSITRCGSTPSTRWRSASTSTSAGDTFDLLARAETGPGRVHHVGDLGPLHAARRRRHLRRGRPPPVV